MGNMGVWKKYEKTTRTTVNSDLSYARLYKDLRGCGKNWIIAKDYGECEIQLCGESFPQIGVVPGDIYVYYTDDNGTLNPQFYLKIESKYDYSNGCHVDNVIFNGTTFEKADISDEFLPIIIDKLSSVYGMENGECASNLEISRGKTLIFKSNK